MERISLKKTEVLQLCFLCSLFLIAEVVNRYLKGGIHI